MRVRVRDWAQITVRLAVAVGSMITVRVKVRSRCIFMLRFRRVQATRLGLGSFLVLNPVITARIL